MIIYVTCAKEKQVHSSFKPKNSLSTGRLLELFHMDLCGSIPIQRLGWNKYILVIVDEYFRFAWVSFLTETNEAFKNF